MPRIGRIAIDQIDDGDVQDIADHLLAYKGTIPDHYRLEGHIPDLLKHVWYAQEAVYEGGPLSRTLLRKVGIVVSMANGCPYCTGAYCSLLSSDFNDGDDAVEQFQNAVEERSLSGFEADVVEFAYQVNDDPHAISDGDIDYLRSEYDLPDTAFVQLVYQVNLVSGYNRLTTVFDAAYDHSYPQTLADRELGMDSDT